MKAWEQEVRYLSKRNSKRKEGRKWREEVIKDIKREAELKDINQFNKRPSYNKE
jgi:hypothetical protein